MHIFEFYIVSLFDFRYFADWFWQLLASHPTSGPGSSLGTIGKLGFTHVEATVQALVETFHAFTATPDAATATLASPVNDGAGCKAGLVTNSILFC